MAEKEDEPIPEEFVKIMKDFMVDMLITFPEYTSIIQKWWISESDTSENNQKKMRFVFEHCMRVFPERLCDILYQKAEMFESASTINTEFLPGISFKYLWTCDIGEKTRETIWKYLQMILICIIGCVRNKQAFGDTSTLFDMINEDEFKHKLEETMTNMQGIFESMAKDATKDATKETTRDTNSEEPDARPGAMPSADDIHNHIHSMMGGKLGDLAREIAEETSQNLNMDMENVTDVKDVFQKLFSNPGKLMNLAKSVSDKLDNKMKNGDITQNELMTEASEMLQKMKGMPGMGNIQEMLSKLGMNGAGIPPMGMGKNAKVNINAMQQQLEKTVKQEAMKKSMQEKLKKKKELKAQEQMISPLQQPSGLSDEELISMFEKTPRQATNGKATNGKATTDAMTNTNTDKKKKKKNK